MAKFDYSKNGYNTTQVDDYILKLTEESESKLHEQKMCINDLKLELNSAKQQLEDYKKKNDNISDALLVAVETSKQIEKNSKKIYELEIERVRALYDKWNSILNDLIKIHPSLKQKYDTKELLDKFSNDIDRVLEQNKKSIQQKQIVGVGESGDGGAIPDTIGIRLLINKMGNTNKPLVDSERPKIVRNPKPSQKTMAEYQSQQITQEKTKKLAKDQIRAISNMQLDKNESYENLVDKFLDSNDQQDNAYSKIMFEKQKNDQFDLKEAVTPTENLEEIMKSFSFYPENEDKKKQSSGN